MTIQNLSDADLLAKTFSIAKEEQKLSFSFLEHLLEVDDRKLFAALGYNT